MLNLFFSVLPFLIVFIFLLSKKNKTFSLLSGSVIGIGIFLLTNGFSTKNFHIVYQVIFCTLFDNIILLLSIFVLFLLINLIIESNLIDSTRILMEKYINSPLKVIIFLLILGCFFSLDDYLLCMAISAILNDIAIKQGFSREKTTYSINSIAVSICCLSPFSSWMPVITQTFQVSKLGTIHLYQILPYNFTAILGILIIIIVGIYRPLSFKSTPYANQKKSNYNNFYKRYEDHIPNPHIMYDSCKFNC